MLLHDARRAGRQTAGGDIVLLEEQDRALWDHEQIAEGLALVEDALRIAGPPAILCGAGRDRGAACARAELSRHRLAADRGPLRGAAADQPVAGDRTQSCRGACRWSMDRRGRSI